MKGADIALAVAQHDHVIDADFHALIAARFVQHAFRERIEPVAVEDRFEVGLEDLGRGVERLLERMPGAVLRKQIGKRCGRLCHVGIPVAGEGLSGTETSRREVDNWQKFQLELAELNSFANFPIRETSSRKATRDAETL